MVGMLRAKQGEQLSLVGYSIGRECWRKGRRNEGFYSAYLSDKYRNRKINSSGMSHDVEKRIPAYSSLYCMFRAQGNNKNNNVNC